MHVGSGWGADPYFSLDGEWAVTEDPDLPTKCRVCPKSAIRWAVLSDAILAFRPLSPCISTTVASAPPVVIVDDTTSGVIQVCDATHEKGELGAELARVWPLYSVA